MLALWIIERRRRAGRCDAVRRVRTGLGHTRDRKRYRGCKNVERGPNRRRPESDVNVCVVDDAKPTGGDTDGSLFVGGDFTADTYTVGAKNAPDCTHYALIVGGDLSLSDGSIRSEEPYKAVHRQGNRILLSEN